VKQINGIVISVLFGPKPQGVLLPDVASEPIFPYLEGMEVHFNPDLQARLTRRATEEGRNLNETVQDVVARYFEEEDRFIEAVKRGEAALDRGEFLTHEQMGDRLRRFLQP
jgi:predicted transcriptional regulator